MATDLTILVGSAASIGLVHTLLGPDHYVPFVAMSRANRWTLRRTLWVTAFCGLGHVLGSVVLGVVGIAAGITLRHLESMAKIMLATGMMVGLAYSTEFFMAWYSGSEGLSASRGLSRSLAESR